MERVMYIADDLSRKNVAGSVWRYYVCAAQLIVRLVLHEPLLQETVRRTSALVSPVREKVYLANRAVINY
jgi:hypothetical protein